jgi:GNAT superfamily N-acetyltransferase
MAGRRGVCLLNTPDFFARVRACEAARVLVAEDAGRIVATAACAWRRGALAGRPATVGYVFQGLTAPEARVRGIGGRLLDRITEHLAAQGAAAAYMLILEGNDAAARAGESRGYAFNRSAVVARLAVSGELPAMAEGEVRRAAPADLPAVADLLNATWSGHDLYSPATADRLAAFIARAPAYDLDGLLLRERNGSLTACLGLWDCSAITRLTVASADAAAQPAGEPRTVRQMLLTPVGWRAAGELAPLLRAANNEAAGRGGDCLLCLSEPGGAMLAAAEGLDRSEARVDLHVKCFGGEGPGDRPVFLDAADI